MNPRESDITRFAFLGAGKMASAIVQGLISGGVAAPENIACLGGSGTSAQKLAAVTGVRLAANLEALLANADVLVLACKPQQFASLDPRLAELAAGKLVLSVLAGFTTARLSEFFAQARGVVAVMPNTPTRVQAGVTAWAAAASLAPSDAALVEKCFGCLGTVLRVEESVMNTVSAVSGSGPGFFFQIVSAFESAAVASGLGRETAALLVRQTFIGSARLLEKTGETPDALRDAVTSPNGSTFAGLQILEKNNLQKIFAAVITAAVARSTELGKM